VFERRNEFRELFCIHVDSHFGAQVRRDPSVPRTERDK
jgi:hypothetical protein